MTWQERIENYVEETGYPEALGFESTGRVFGMWIMGADYRVGSGYYGGYPAGYLKRVRSLFPDKERTLHVFSGMVDRQTFPGDTVDTNLTTDPTYLADAHDMKGVPLDAYDLVLADPPYSVEDCDHYQCSMVKRNVVMRTLGKGLKQGSHVVWLDQVLPMYRKDQWELEAVIGMLKSTNHRCRMVTIFRRR